MQPEITNNQLMQRYETQRSERRSIEQIWNEINRLVIPWTGDFFRDFDGGENSVDWYENRDCFDSTATYGVNTLAASIHGSLTSPSIKWFGLKFRLASDNEVEGAKEWLEDSGEKIYQALQDSNFNLEANEMYNDLVAFGTSILVEESQADMTTSPDVWQGLDFQCIPIRECFFEQNARGQVFRFYRRHEWNAIEICTKFPDGDVPERIKKQTVSGDGTQRYDVIFCVYERDFYPTEKVDRHTAAIPAKRPIGWKYILKSDKTTLQEGGYYEMPTFIPRWRKMSGSQWGYSPAMVAMPDIKTLNAMTEQGLSAGEKAIDPPIFVPEKDLISDLDLTAAAVNVVRSTEGIIPYPNATNFQYEFQKEQMLRQSIREAFHMDELQLKESPAMTATEVQARMELMQRLLGPTLGRLQSDFLDPLITRTFNILWRAGQLLPIPEGVQGEMDISYIGALTRAQSSDKVVTIERWVQTQASLAEIHPEVLDNVDFDEAAREQARLLNTPAKVVRDQLEVDKLRAERQEQMEKQRNMDRAEQGSNIAKNLGGAEALGGVTEDLAPLQ